MTVSHASKSNVCNAHLVAGCAKEVGEKCDADPGERAALKELSSIDGCHGMKIVIRRKGFLAAETFNTNPQ